MGISELLLLSPIRTIRKVTKMTTWHWKLAKNTIKIDYISDNKEGYIDANLRHWKFKKKYYKNRIYFWINSIQSTIPYHILTKKAQEKEKEKESEKVISFQTHSSLDFNIANMLIIIQTKKRSFLDDIFHRQIRKYLWIYKIWRRTLF